MGCRRRNGSGGRPPSRNHGDTATGETAPERGDEDRTSQVAAKLRIENRELEADGSELNDPRTTEGGYVSRPRPTSLKGLPARVVSSAAVASTLTAALASALAAALASALAWPIPPPCSVR